MINIIVDADATHSLKLIESIAEKYQVQLYFVSDSSHMLFSDYAKVIIVDKQSDSADYKILELCDINSIVISQDYALASLCLTKNAIVINPYGFIINNDNIDQLLNTRYLNQQARKQNIRLSNQKKLKEETIIKFKNILEETLSKKIVSKKIS